MISRLPQDTRGGDVVTSALPTTLWAPIYHTMNSVRHHYAGVIVRTDHLGRHNSKRCDHTHSRPELAVECAWRWAKSLNEQPCPGCWPDDPAARESYRCHAHRKAATS